MGNELATVPISALCGMSLNKTSHLRANVYKICEILHRQNKKTRLAPCFPFPPACSLSQIYYIGGRILKCLYMNRNRTVAGLDVHKDSVYLCILSEFGELIEKVFGVLTYQLEEMRDLMHHHHVVEVSMESTSVYWIPIWRVLSPHFKLNLANPYFIKQLPGRKSDVKDAQWIAECTMK